MASGSKPCTQGLFCAGHTVIAHEGHLGYVQEGQLLCYKGGIPRQCTLQHAEDRQCEFISIKDHIHGPSCGHEMVPHGDHMDYLVDGRLHHVIQALDSLHSPQCCMRRCLGEVLASQVVDHGEVLVVRQRNPGMCKADSHDHLPALTEHESEHDDHNHGHSHEATHEHHHAHSHSHSHGSCGSGHVHHDGHDHHHEHAHEHVPVPAVAVSHEHHHDHKCSTSSSVAVAAPAPAKKSCCSSGHCKAALPQHATVDLEAGTPAEVSADNANKAAAGGTVTTKIFAAGICCPAEINLIHNILNPLSGVESVDVQVISKAVTVRHDPALTSPGVLVAALNAASLEASLGGRGGQEAVREKLRPPITVILAGLLMIIALVSYGHHPGYLHEFRWVAIGSIAVGIPPILKKAYVSLRNKTLDINVLMTLAVAGAVALGDYVEGSGIVFLFGLAEWLEDRCVSRARAAITEVLQLQPATALVLPPDTAAAAAAAAGGTASDSMQALEAQPRMLEQVAVGSLVLVRPGDRIPLDGTVTQGVSAADEAMLTGEARLVEKKPGSEVFGGTLNMGVGTLVVRTSAVAADSTVARLGALMESAAAQKSSRERAVEVFARWYTPSVVVAAGIVALVPSLVHTDNYQHWIYIALVVLVTACPCALVISTPVTAVCGLARAAKQGVIVKGSLHLETLGRLKTITFDKSGTLTEGHFQVIHAQAFPQSTGASDHDGNQPAAAQAIDRTQAGLARVLSLTAALEAHSSHPMAPTIIGYAAANSAYTKLQASNVLAAPGLGLLGLVDGCEVAVGSARLAHNMLRSRRSKRADSLSSASTSTCSSSFTSQHHTVDAKLSPEEDAMRAREEAIISAAVEQWGAQGASVSFVVVDGVLAGVLAMRDMPRKTSKEAVTMLEARGVQCVMLTGDLRRTADVVGKGLGLDLDHVHAELLPADKLELVKLYRVGKQQAGRALRTDRTLKPLKFKTIMGDAASADKAAGDAPHVAVHIEGYNEDEQQNSNENDVVVGKRGCFGRAKQKEHVLAHVGDGINDAPALAAADVGIAMGTSGAAIAVEAGDVVLFSSDLRALPFARDLGRRVTFVIMSNITFSMVIKIVVLVLAFLGYATLWVSVLADVGSSLIVVLHALTVLAFQRHLKPKGSSGKGHSHSHSHASKDCCSSKACGTSATKDCCSSKACGDSHAHSHSHSHASKDCCSSKACGTSHAHSHSHSHTSKDCCSSKACGTSHAAPTSKTCGSGGSCSAVTAAEAHAHSHGHAGTTPGHHAHAPTPTPCCSKTSCGSKGVGSATKPTASNSDTTAALSQAAGTKTCCSSKACKAASPANGDVHGHAHEQGGCQASTSCGHKHASTALTPATAGAGCCSSEVPKGVHHGCGKHAAAPTAAESNAPACCGTEKHCGGDAICNEPPSNKKPCCTSSMQPAAVSAEKRADMAELLAAPARVKHAGSRKSCELMYMPVEIADEGVAAPVASATKTCCSGTACKGNQV